MSNWTKRSGGYKRKAFSPAILEAEGEGEVTREIPCSRGEAMGRREEQRSMLSCAGGGILDSLEDSDWSPKNSQEL